jgi:hypothetical protein
MPTAVEGIQHALEQIRVNDVSPPADPTHNPFLNVDSIPGNPVFGLAPPHELIGLLFNGPTDTVGLLGITPPHDPLTG